MTNDKQQVNNIYKDLYLEVADLRETVYQEG